MGKGKKHTGPGKAISDAVIATIHKQPILKTICNICYASRFSILLFLSRSSHTVEQSWWPIGDPWYMYIAGNTICLATLNPQGTRETHNKLNRLEEPPSDTNTIPIQYFYFYFLQHLFSITSWCSFLPFFFSCCCLRGVVTRKDFYIFYYYYYYYYYYYCYFYHYYYCY
jgi:hypothetical protein